jgi:hypothetical protein
MSDSRAIRAILIEMTKHERIPRKLLPYILRLAQAAGLEVVR